MPRWLGARGGPGGFLGNVATLAGSTAASQLAIVATGPILARLYAPEAWGAFGLLSTFVALASVVTALGYEKAIIGAQTEEDALGLTKLTLWLTGPIVAILIGALAWFIHTGWFGFGALPWPALAWAGCLLVLMQAFVSVRYWHMRAERFPLLARSMVAQNVGRAILPVATSFASAGMLGLAAGEAAGRALGLTSLVRAMPSAARAAWSRTGPAALQGLARTYRQFAYAGLPSAMIDATALALPLPLIAGRFGAEAAGQFALAQRILQAPAALVGRSVAEAFHARIARHVRERPEHVAPFFRRTSLMLIVVAMIPGVLILAVGPAAFAWAFGARWRPAGELAVAMVPWATAQLIVSPLSRAVYVLGGQKEKLVYDIVSLALVLLVAWLGAGAGWGLWQTVAFLGWGQVISYGVYYIVLWRVVHRRSVA